jgi:hypothetical protein
LVAALVATIGGHWAILQTAAWVGMAVNYSNTESLCVALSKTFDGKHPCKLCKLVKEGKKSERKSDAQLDLKKMDFFALHAVEFYFAPLKQNPLSPIPLMPSRSQAPPTPPPLFA